MEVVRAIDATLHRPLLVAAVKCFRDHGHFLYAKGALLKLDAPRELITLYIESQHWAEAFHMLTAHPDLRGIFAASEPGAIGAAQAIKAAGKSGEVKLVAFDAAEEQITALKEGSIQALIVQNPYNMGYLGVKAVMDALGGKPVEKIIDTGVTVVTMENFNDPEIQKLLYPL